MFKGVCGFWVFIRKQRHEWVGADGGSGGLVTMVVWRGAMVVEGVEDGGGGWVTSSIEREEVGVGVELWW